MKRLCEIDHLGLLAALPLLQWVSGVRGECDMIKKWSDAIPVDPVFDAIAAHYPNRTRVRSRFSKLVPGQYIHQHCDRQDNVCDVRVHVPITSNPSCMFVSGDLAFHMTPGWAWEINPGLMHCTGNGGETDRVHLFFNMRTP